MSEVLKVTGLQELNRALGNLASNVQRQYLRGAVAAGARVFKDAAVRNVPVRSGKLRRAIYSKWITEASGDSRQTFLVSVRRGKRFQSQTKVNRRGKSVTTKDTDAYYWTWVEFGHVATGPKGGLKGGSRRRAAAREKLKSAGRFVPPRPFLRPAFSSNVNAAIDAVRIELARRIAEGVR